MLLVKMPDKSACPFTIFQVLSFSLDLDFFASQDKSSRGSSVELELLVKSSEFSE